MDVVPSKGRVQRMTMRLARHSLYTAVDLSNAALSGALQQCAQDDKTSLAAAAEVADQLQRVGEQLATERSKAEQLLLSLEQRRGAAATARQQAGDEEARARAAIDSAVEAGNFDALNGAERTLQEWLAADEAARPGRGAEASSLDSMGRLIQAREGAIAALDAERVRLEASRRDHLAAAAKARWDAGVNKLFLPMLAQWEIDNCDGLAELRVPFHQARRVLASGLMGVAMTAGAFESLSPSVLRRDLDEARALLDAVAADVSLARTRADDAKQQDESLMANAKVIKA